MKFPLFPYVLQRICDGNAPTFDFFRLRRLKNHNFLQFDVHKDNFSCKMWEFSDFATEMWEFSELKTPVDMWEDFSGNLKNYGSAHNVGHFFVVS